MTTEYHMWWPLQLSEYPAQVIQERIDSVTFRLVLDQQVRFDRGSEEVRLSEQARKALGPSCRVGFEYPAEIEVTSTGKHRFTISHVSSAASR